jgi:hypothetical protein
MTETRERDELHARADEIHAADRAEDYATEVVRMETREQETTETVSCHNCGRAIFRAGTGWVHESDGFRQCTMPPELGMLARPDTFDRHDHEEG